MFVLTRLLFAALLGAVLACCARPPSPSCPMRLRDDQETPEEAKAGDACHRAGLTLKALACPEYNANWDAFCRDMVARGVPICPTKLARVKTCAEVDEVCR